MTFRDHQLYLLFLLLVKFHESGGVDVKFTQEPSDPSYFNNGSDANLVWNYAGPHNKIRGIVYSVLVNGKFEVMIFNNSRGVQEHPNIPSSYKGRVKMEGRATLIIKNISPRDNTKFRCVISKNPSGEVKSVVKLIVAEALLINLSLGGKYFIEGSIATVTCKASGKPPPYVAWIRNGVQESSGKEAASLEFNNINRTDAGQYTCQANNSMEVTSINTTIVVHYKPEGARLTTDASQNTVIKGDTVTFKCIVMAAMPQVSIYKFYFNSSLLSNNSNSEYTLNNVNRSQHHGEYKCVPHNAVGDGAEATVRLNINVPVQFTEVPQNITVNTSTSLFLSCDASGFPEPKIRWEKSGIKFSDTKQLNISSTNRNDAGEYVCIASNGVRQEKTVRAYVTVQYPPTIQNVTTSAKKSWIGQTVTLKCLSDGVPTPTLSWYKPKGSGINNVTARESKVQVPLKSDQDFGHYKCIAANGLPPSDEKLIKINQIKKPGKASIKSESVIQATFITIQWTAPADDGGSSITGFQMILQKDGTEIKKVNITDPGTTSYSFRGLEKDTNYTVKLFSRNFVFEGDPTVWNIKTKFEGAPDVVEMDELPGETTDDTIILKWKEPESNGKIIIMYTVYQRVVTDGKVGEWTIIQNISDVSVRGLKITLERGKVYQFAITATNELGESLKQGKANNLQVKTEGKEQEPSPTKGSQSSADNEMDTAIYAGAAAAGVLLIIGVIVIIILWKRRKVSSRENDEMPMDGLRGSANHYEAEDGYQEAAQSFQASAPEAEANYAQVDMTKKKKNRRPPADEYAQVDKSKKTKKRPKRPGELDYAELDEFRRHDAGHAPGPSGASAAAVVRPPAYEGTEYADITQFGVPQPDPTYANVSGGDVTYSNMQSM
ncbi:neural cell adhesion molecule 1 isoform X2 [Pocillopora verrucosa]|uniref:neural cell adhesion molecule 1 isoform X2 n=1 Tax=Pocillopora verrucosa TaxID=203993 RepID=UPI003342D2E4